MVTSTKVTNIAHGFVSPLFRLTKSEALVPFARRFRNFYSDDVYHWSNNEVVSSDSELPAFFSFANSVTIGISGWLFADKVRFMHQLDWEQKKWKTIGAQKCSATT